MLAFMVERLSMPVDPHPCDFDLSEDDDLAALELFGLVVVGSQRDVLSRFAGFGIYRRADSRPYHR